ncbi:hypothetical protein BXZ70DRAFT_866943, partial [Cristinia sonorae]
ISWLKANVKVRWDNRLSERLAGGADANATVLVLKTEYNAVWDYFHAKAFGQTMIDYWREWYRRAERGEYGLGEDGKTLFPAPRDGHFGDLDLVLPGHMTQVLTSDGPIEVPDLRKISIIDASILVSKKRTRNMFDFTSLWKRSVFERLDEVVLADRDDHDPDQAGLVPGLGHVRDDEIQGAHERYITEHRENIHRRSPSPDVPLFG